MSNITISNALEASNPQQLLESVIVNDIRDCGAEAVPDLRVIREQNPVLHSNESGKRINDVGDYELLEEVARGGMGVVYKARQKSLGRIVALKMLLTGHFAKGDDVQRFQIEAQAAASLQHPNIVAIHEQGLHAGLHYFSMEFVEGRSLSAVLRKNVLTAKQAANYVRQMAEAIHYAHQHGTLHRDLKPSNVLIDSRDQVRITDFGLAMRVDGDSGLTQTGQIVGTPSYMPPEQAQGNRRLIGPASDVYSLGAILYECLTGRAPFRADSMLKTIDQVIHREAASPRVLNPGINRDLETICLKCLEKKPHRRYGSAQLLADDLGRSLDDRPILARPVGVIDRTLCWCRRNPAVASLMTTVAACLVGIAVASHCAIEANKQANYARLQRQRADAQAALAEKRREEADNHAKLAEQRLHSSDWNLAQVTWQNGSVGHIVQLSERHCPKTHSDSPHSEEWYDLDCLGHRGLLTRKCHFDVFVCLAFSPDGEQLDSTSRDEINPFESQCFQRVKGARSSATTKAVGNVWKN